MAPSLSPTQWLRWTLSYPTVALVVKLPNPRDGSSSKISGLAEHPSTSGRLPTPDALLIDFQQRGDLQGADKGGDPSIHRYLARSTGLAIFVTISPTQVTTRGAALYADGFYTRERFVATSTNEAIPRTSVQHTGGLPGLYRESIRQVATPGGFYTIDGRLPTGTEQWGRLYRSCSRPFLLDQAAILLKVANSPKHDGFVPDHSTASLIMGLHTIVGVSCCRSIVCRRLWSLRSN